MSIPWIRDHYGVPAKRGGRVRYTGDGVELLGTITGADGPHLRVRLDGEKSSSPMHPLWMIEYLPKEPMQ